MKRKAQAALEFLMTYGWAFLVILVMIGALAYFGVLSPTRLLPDRCTVTAGFQCEEFLIDGANDQVKIVLQNGLGESIEFNGTGAAEYAEGGLTTSSINSLSPDADTVISTEEDTQLTYSITDLGDFTGEKIRITFSAQYTPVGKSLTKTLTGEVFGTVE